MAPTDAAPRIHDVIIAEVAQRMGVSEEGLRARGRSSQVVAARHAAFWALNHTGLSPARIARLLGLNHSTVLHGLARAEQHPARHSSLDYARRIGSGNEGRGTGGRGSEAARELRVVESEGSAPVWSGSSHQDQPQEGTPWISSLPQRAMPLPLGRYCP